MIFLLNHCYEEGIGVKQNMKKALYWHKIATKKRITEFKEKFKNFENDVCNLLKENS